MTEKKILRKVYDRASGIWYDIGGSVNASIDGNSLVIGSDKIDANAYPSSTLDILTTQVIYNAMMSYHMHIWSIGSNNKFSYGNYLTNNTSGNSMTALDPEGSGTVYDKLDCSTFVLLCLMGIPFQDSPYNGKTNISPVTTFERFFKVDPERNPSAALNRPS